MLTTIVFDLDDTLYRELDYVHSGFRAVADWSERTLGMDGRAAYHQLVSIFDGGNRNKTFNEFLERHERPDLSAQMLMTYREHNPQLATIDGVPELLQRLASRFKLGLLTDGFAHVQRRKIEALGLERFFDAIVISDEWGREAWKPSQIAFQKILELLDTAPERAVYVGENSLKDFLGARQLGMQTVRVRYPIGFYSLEEPPTPEHAADIDIHSLVDLESALVEHFAI